MSGALSQQSSNPTWRAFDNYRAEAPAYHTAMTMSGVVGKTTVLLGLLLAAGVASFGYCEGQLEAARSGQAAGGHLGLIFGGGIVAFVVALVLSFKPAWAPLLAPAYALLEGLALGGVTAYVETIKPGIGVEAITLTLGILGGMLFLYYNGVLRATPWLTKAITASMMAIMVTYLASFVGRMLGYEIPYIHGNGLIGIGFSLFVVGVASFSFILDFANIEANVYQGAPKFMEWYCGFSLMVTVVWLYMEIVKLLLKLNSRD